MVGWSEVAAAEHPEWIRQGVPRGGAGGKGWDFYIITNDDYRLRSAKDIERYFGQFETDKLIQRRGTYEAFLAVAGKDKCFESSNMGGAGAIPHERDWTPEGGRGHKAAGEGAGTAAAPKPKPKKEKAAGTEAKAPKAPKPAKEDGVAVVKATGKRKAAVLPDGTTVEDESAAAEPAAKKEKKGTASSSSSSSAAAAAGGAGKPKKGKAVPAQKAAEMPSAATLDGVWAKFTPKQPVVRALPEGAQPKVSLFQKKAFLSDVIITHTLGSNLLDDIGNELHVYQRTAWGNAKEQATDPFVSVVNGEIALPDPSTCDDPVSVDTTYTIVASGVMLCSATIVASEGAPASGESIDKFLNTLIVKDRAGFVQTDDMNMSCFIAPKNERTNQEMAPFFDALPGGGSPDGMPGNVWLLYAMRRLGAKTLKSDPPTLGAAVPPAPAPSAAADIASPAGGSAGVAEPAPSS